MNEIQAVRGDSFGRSLLIKTDGVATNISTWIVFFTVKRNKNDADVDAVIQKVIGTDEHSDPTHGITRIALTAEETEDLDGKYSYDIQIKKPDGTILTPVISTILFSEDVTIRSS